MSLLKSTKEKVVQVKSDLLAKSIMEQISNGGVDYIDGFERMYSRLNKTYVPRNEHWRILTNADFSVTRGEYLGDGCYAWRPTGNIYLVTSRNEFGVSFQIFDTLKSTQLTVSLREDLSFLQSTLSEFRRIKTRPHLSVMAYRDYWYNVVVDKYTNIFTIDNSDRPFVEELFKEVITRKLMHDYNYS
jgi:hypothetical protein